MNEEKIQFYLTLASHVSEKGTCKRAKVGAVLVNDDRVIAIGYNGAPRGLQHCTEAGCLMVDEVVRTDPRKIHEVRPHCKRAVHAEENVIANAAYGGACTKGALLFCTYSPCYACTRVLLNAGIHKVFYLKEYQDVLAKKIWEEALFDVQHHPIPAGV